MFYVILFSALAVLLVVAVGTLVTRNRAELRSEAAHEHSSDAKRRARKAKRAQSRHDRRKRH